MADGNDDKVKADATGKASRKAAPKKAAPKKAAPKKAAVTRPVQKAAPAVKKAPRASAAAKVAPKADRVDAQQRAAMIAEAAYYRAEKRGFAGGDPVADWLSAEAEIDALIAKRS